MRIGEDRTLELDIATRRIGPDEDVYVVQPGKDYRLYQHFRDRESVFLDFPDLQLSPAHKPGRDELRQKIVRSQTIRDWLLAGRPDPEPVRNLAV